jgi:hypothetical protein
LRIPIDPSGLSRPFPSTKMIPFYIIESLLISATRKTGPGYPERGDLWSDSGKIKSCFQA